MGNVRFTRPLRLWALVLLAALMAAWVLLARATPLPLQGRTVDGQPVASDAPEAVFEYDPHLDITWLRDWNYAYTSGYDAEGRMYWHEALDWAAQLSVGRFDGWSLPATVWPDPSCVDTWPDDDPQYQEWRQCTGGALNYLWFEELGNDEGSIDHPGPFLNVQQFGYWTATPGELQNSAWYWAQGQQGEVQIYFVASPFSVAVRAGDVLPEPRSLALTLLALGAAAAATKRPRLKAGPQPAPAAVRVRARCR